MSFVYVPDRRMLIVDTAGAQATVTFRPQDIEPIADAQATEAFLFELIARMCDAIVFVVSDFTWMEQKTLAMFHNKDKQRGRARELIVVHNLRTTSKEQEARQLFQQQIVTNYEGATSHLSDLVYKANKTPIVHHVTICKAGSPAGRMFNQKNLAYVMNLLEYGPGDVTGKVLSELLLTNMTELLPKFLLIDTEGQDGVQWRLEYDAKAENVVHGSSCDGREVLLIDTEGFDGYLHAGAIVSKSGTLKMKTQGVISEFGEVQTFNASFTPDLNIFEEQQGNQVMRTLQIECPGVAKDGFSVEEVDEGLLVTIDKKKTINEASVQPIKPIMEKFGEFKHKFPISDRTFRFCEEELSLENGILKIILRKELGCTRRVTLGFDGKVRQEVLQMGSDAASARITSSDILHKSASELAQADGYRPELPLPGGSVAGVVQQHGPVPVLHGASAQTCPPSVCSERHLSPETQVAPEMQSLSAIPQQHTHDLRPIPSSTDGSAAGIGQQQIPVPEPNLESVPPQVLAPALEGTCATETIQPASEVHSWSVVSAP
jgi:HSP20 family molecular chaperone IbpA